MGRPRAYAEQKQGFSDVTVIRDLAADGLLQKHYFCSFLHGQRGKRGHRSDIARATRAPDDLATGASSRAGSDAAEIYWSFFFQLGDAQAQMLQEQVGHRR